LRRIVHCRLVIGAEMKWVVVGLLLFHGQQVEIVNERNGPCDTRAQCERWLAKQPERWPYGVDEVNMIQGLPFKNAHVRCTDIEE
jgi:hypothetical protein